MFTQPFILTKLAAGILTVNQADRLLHLYHFGKGKGIADLVPEVEHLLSQEYSHEQSVALTKLIIRMEATDENARMLEYA